MKLKNIVQKTGIVKEGMTIRQGFQECVKNNVPGVPFVGPGGEVTGCFSIRETLLAACIPDVMVEYADLLGDDAGCLKMPEQHALKVMSLPISSFDINQAITITSDTAVAKSIALMEKHKINYLFVVDGNEYHGVITIDGIARRMLELGELEQVDR